MSVNGRVGAGVCLLCMLCISGGGGTGGAGRVYIKERGRKVCVCVIECVSATAGVHVWMSIYI